MPSLGRGARALLALLVLALPALVACEKVVMIPNSWTFTEEHLGIPLEQFLRQAIRVYNHSDLIATVPDDWEYAELLANMKSSGRSKRDDHALHGEVHIGPNRRQRWIRDSIGLDVEDYVGAISETVTNSWALDRIDQTLKPLNGQYLGFKAGVSDLRVVHLYVVDTGVDSHPDIPQSISYDFSVDTSDYTDCNSTYFI